jgi:hypothetical protein
MLSIISKIGPPMGMTAVFSVVYVPDFPPASHEGSFLRAADVNEILRCERR